MPTKDTNEITDRTLKLLVVLSHAPNGLRGSDLHHHRLMVADADAAAAAGWVHARTLQGNPRSHGGGRPPGSHYELNDAGLAMIRKLVGMLRADAA